MPAYYSLPQHATAIARLSFSKQVAYETPCTGVGVRKEIYRLRGIIADGHVRHPAPSIAPSAAKMLAAAIEATLPGVDVTKPLDIDSL